MYLYQIQEKQYLLQEYIFLKTFSDLQNFCASCSMYLDFLSMKPIKILFIEAFLQQLLVFLFCDQYAEVHCFILHIKLCI